MKYIQVIDGAENCAYDIFTATDEEFALMFPGEGQNIEFVADFFDRIGEARASAICNALWERPVDKSQVQGIHGTLFYGLDTKKPFYPNKRESDLDGSGRRHR